MATEPRSAIEERRGRTDDECANLGKNIGNVALVRHGDEQHLGTRLRDRKHLLLRLFESAENPGDPRMRIAHESRVKVRPSHGFIQRPADRDRHRHDEGSVILAGVEPLARLTNRGGISSPNDPDRLLPVIDDEHRRIRRSDEHGHVRFSDRVTLIHWEVAGNEPQSSGQAGQVCLGRAIMSRVEHEGKGKDLLGHSVVLSESASAGGRGYARTVSVPTATTPPIEGIPAAVLDLVGRLRRAGVAVSTSETLDAVAALASVRLDHRRDVRSALKATLVKDSTHDVIFERSFEAVFRRARMSRDEAGSISTGSSDGEALDDLASALREGDLARVDDLLEAAIDEHGGSQDDGRSAGHHAQRTLRRMNIPNLYRRYLDQSDADSHFDRALETAEAAAAMEQMQRRMQDLVSGRMRDADAGPSMQQLEDPEDRPLLRAGADELVAMRQAMRPLARRLATRLGNRRRRGTAGLDMRRTIRSSMGTGGVPVQPVLRRRRPTKPDLIVLCDVSGSTAQFAPFTLTLLHAIHQEFRRVRSFVFIDGLVEITDILASSPGVLDPHHLLARKGLIVKDGRSDYRRAFASFLDTWGDAVTAKTTVIIAGDARSHDREPATAEVAELEHRARRLYWLNPEPRSEWDTLDSRASDYGRHCTNTFEVSTIRELIAAVTEIV